jgi:hypothetical protein
MVVTSWCGRSADTITNANARLLGAHTALPLTEAFGNR